MYLYMTLCTRNTGSTTVKMDCDRIRSENNLQVFNIELIVFPGDELLKVYKIRFKELFQEGLKNNNNFHLYLNMLFKFCILLVSVGLSLFTNRKMGNGRYSMTSSATIEVPINTVH